MMAFIPATGCTEPGALALTAAAAAAHLGEEVKSIHTFASGNIIKNAYSAGIPGTSLVGIEYAVAIGAIVAQPEKQLQVINGITSEQLEKACALVDAKAVKVELAKVPEKLYIEVEVKGEHNTAKAIIANVHTNIIYIEENGKAVLDKRHEQGNADGGYSDADIKEILSVAKIFEYATTVDLSMLDKIRLSIDVNSAISEEGMRNPYGLCTDVSVEDMENVIASDPDYPCVDGRLPPAGRIQHARRRSAVSNLVPETRVSPIMLRLAWLPESWV